MKDLLTEFIKSLFKYIINPTVWSRVYADTNTPSPAQQPPNTHQIPYSNNFPMLHNPTNPSDIRSLEVDLSKNKFKLTFGNSGAVDVLTSGVELLSLDDRLSGASTISSIEYPSSKNDATDSTKSDSDCIPNMEMKFDEIYSEDIENIENELKYSQRSSGKAVNKERRHKKESRREKRKEELEQRKSLNASEEQRIHDEMFQLSYMETDVIEISSDTSELPLEPISESEAFSTTDTNTNTTSPSPSSVGSSVEIITDFSFSS